MPRKGLQPALNVVRVVMRNGASFNILSPMRRTGPYFLQHDTTNNPAYTGEASGLSMEDERLQKLMSKYEGFVAEGFGEEIASGSYGGAPPPKGGPAGKGKKKK